MSEWGEIDPADDSSTIHDVRTADLQSIGFRGLVEHARRNQSTSGTPTGLAWHLWHREDVRGVFRNTATLVEHVRRLVGSSPAQVGRKPYLG